MEGNFVQNLIQIKEQPKVFMDPLVASGLSIKNEMKPETKLYFEKIGSSNCKQGQTNYNMCGSSENPFSPLLEVEFHSDDEDQLIIDEQFGKLPNNMKQQETRLDERYNAQVSYNNISQTNTDSCVDENPQLSPSKMYTSYLDDKSPLVMLIKAACNKKQKQINCHLCNKPFSGKSNLRRHMLTHTDQKNFRCSYCGLQFSLKSTLQIHVRQHTEEHPYVCQYCDKRFKQHSNWSTHTRTHTKEKPFSCHVCFRSFSDKSSCNKHVKLHSNEKPFSCKICDKKFQHKSVLVIHVRTHTNEKPFNCTICDRDFACPTNYRKHMLKHK